MSPSGKVKIACGNLQGRKPDPATAGPTEAGSQKIQKEFYCDMVSGTRLPETLALVYFTRCNDKSNGMSPSGKALVSGTSIRGFKSLHPSQNKIRPVWSVFILASLAGI